MDGTQGLSNFRKVSDCLYRGGQPDERGLKALSEIPIKTVVSLRWRKKQIEPERNSAENLGLRFVSIPLNYWTLPNYETVKDFLKIMDDENNHPVFVHCYHGADRTGVLVAMYRVLRNDWTLRDAYDEMLACGHHRFSTVHFKFALWRIAWQAEKEKAKNL